MAVIRVLLVCGGGASSGFLANNMRKAAKEQGLDMNIQAKSESAIADYMDDIDVLLIGPPMKYMEAEIRELISDSACKAAVVSDEVYGGLDGAGAIQLVFDTLKEE
jgi:PTS system cellobiose-specific IIB component